MNKQIHFTIFLFFFCLVFSNNLRAQAIIQEENSEILSFEDGEVHFKSTSTANLAVNNQHSKLGRHSLVFTWVKDSTSISLQRKIKLVPNHDIHDNSTNMFIYWIYSLKKQTNAVLRFEFLKANRLCTWFDYNLDFSGWREAWVSFDRDMQGNLTNDMDELRITVLGSSEGTLFFDLIRPSSLQHLRNGMPDVQIAHLKSFVMSDSIKKEQNALSAKFVTFSTKDSIAFKQIEKRLSDFYLENNSLLNLDSLQVQIDAIGIIKNEDETL
ncbi:MAG: chondroitinase family protein, partial [Bacteroidales bacterium]